MQCSPLRFVQLSDVHVGNNVYNPATARHHLRWALGEAAALGAAGVVVTGDVITDGTAGELEEYARLIAESAVPVYSLPAGHDLLGGREARAWEALIGPTQQAVELPGLQIVLWDDLPAAAERLAWLEAHLEPRKPTVVCHHTPLVPTATGYHVPWDDPLTEEVLALCRQREVLAMVSGHWHRNGERWVAGQRMINTGALCGWEWVGVPPHQCFPTRAGYRLFEYDGVLRSLWREGSYWDMPGPRCQVCLEWVGPAHTGGPRPEVRPVDVLDECSLRATAYAVSEPVVEVEWSVLRRDWRPMTRTHDGLWSEWEARLDPLHFRDPAELVCCVRAVSASGETAMDQVPVRLGRREASSRPPVAAYALPERLFLTHYRPD